MNRRQGRSRTFFGFVAAAGLVVGALALFPSAAHAATTRTATAQGFGYTQAAGSANAQSNARSALTAQARAANEVCTGVTSSATLVYIVPGGGGFQYTGTASGTCGPGPVYDTPRSATARGEGATSSVAQANAFAKARSTILGLGHDCTGWTASYTYVWSASQGVWSIYDAAVSATCVE